MVVGQVDSQGRTYFRCYECGDSNKNPNTAHAYYDTNGRIHCHRCDFNGELSIDQLIAMSTGMLDIDEAVEQLLTLDLRATYSQRYSALETFTEQRNWVWHMRTPSGRTVGYHKRSIEGKYCTNIGSRGLGFATDRLISSPSSPLVIVEGPYDCISDQHACVFGAISKGSAKHLMLQYVWLQPDPDQLDHPQKRAKMQGIVKHMLDHMVFVEGVILGPADPDECKPEQLSHVFLQDVLRGSWD